jgi:hypothetical protein
LIVKDALAERLAVAGVFDGLVDDGFMRLEAGRGAPQPLLLELHHLVGEALALLADAIALRHPHIVEENLRGIGRAHAHLVEFARDLDALGLHRHADQRLVAVLRPVAGVGEQADPVGLDAVGDPHLAAVDDVIVAIGARMGFDRRHVRSGARLGDTDARHRIARYRRGQEFAANFVGSEPRQRRRRHVGLHADRHRHAAAADRAKLLGHHQRVAVIQPLAAKFHRLVEAEKSEVAEFLEQLMGREDVGLLPFIDERIDLGRDEFLQGAAGFVVVSSKEHVISISSSFRDAPLGAGPESILPAGVMDSGLARFARALSDKRDALARGMTQV